MYKIIVQVSSRYFSLLFVVDVCALPSDAPRLHVRPALMLLRRLCLSDKKLLSQRSAAVCAQLIDWTIWH